MAQSATRTVLLSIMPLNLSLMAQLLYWSLSTHQIVFVWKQPGPGANTTNTRSNAPPEFAFTDQHRQKKIDHRLRPGRVPDRQKTGLVASRNLIRQWRTVRERDRVRFKQESREENRLELGHDSTLLALVNPSRPSRYLTREELAEVGSWIYPLLALEADLLLAGQTAPAKHNEHVRESCRRSHRIRIFAACQYVEPSRTRCRRARAT